jgi:hypothetical protein
MNELDRQRVMYLAQQKAPPEVQSLCSISTRKRLLVHRVLLVLIVIGSAGAVWLY